MIDFDPAKEAINLSKHGVSLARWVDLEVLAIVKDDRFDYGARPDIAHTEPSKVYRTALSSIPTDQSPPRTCKGNEALCHVN